MSQSFFKIFISTIWFCFIFLIQSSINAQDIEANFIFLDKTKIDKAKIPEFKHFKDTLAIQNYISRKLNNLKREGYYASSVDSVKKTKASLLVYIHLGNYYQGIEVQIDSTFEYELRKTNSAYLKRTLKYIDVDAENQKLIAYFNQNGYPKAKVKLDSLSVDDKSLKLKLKIDRGPNVIYGSIQNEGNLKLSESFLQGYFSVKPGRNYNQKLIDKLNAMYAGLSMAKRVSSAKIILNDDKVDLILNLDKINNNRFDGILGVLPNDKTTGKTVLTGEVNVYLQNIFKQSDEWLFRWKKLESSSQELNLKLTVPYLFKTKLGTSGQLDLLKQDTSYLNTSSKVALQMYWSGQNYWGINFQNKSSATLIPDSLLPNNLGAYSYNSYGLVNYYRTTNRFFNPQKGLIWEWSINAGYKQRTDILEKQLQTELIHSVEYYVPILKNSVLLLKSESSWLWSDSFMLNELSRIGGLKHLRGFMEYSIYASSYSIATVEYRFLFDQYSAIYAFADMAWVEKKLDVYAFDYPIGVGIGIFFKTKAGLFTISYALGQQKNDPMQIKNAKIHFGYESRF
ncbi:MAG: hypothetical protein JXR60_05765 [Bacteroidales bacterium]|nr:hypothetical protein [Bacteroidales bacterium]